MATAGTKTDIAQFGMERFSATPRQADLMIVAGQVSQRMAPVLRRHRSMTRWRSRNGVLALGVCASSGGMFNNPMRSCGAWLCCSGRHLPTRLPAAPGDAAARNPGAVRKIQQMPVEYQPGDAIAGPKRRRCWPGHIKVRRTAAMSPPDQDARRRPPGLPHRGGG